MQFQEMKRMIIPSPLCPRSDESLYSPKTASPSTNEFISHPAMSLPFDLLS